MSVKIVLDNAIAQLNAQKTKAYNDALTTMTVQLNPELDAYKAAKKKEYDETVAQLKAAYDAAIAEKQSAINSQAKAYAETAVAQIDATIVQLQKLSGAETA